MNHVDLAQMCNDIYNPNAKWNNIWEQNDIYVTHKITDEGDNVIIFRGSVTPRDWLRDFRGWPRRNKQIGWCHQGFLEEMTDVRDEICSYFVTTGTVPTYITGHSLGAARALILTGLLLESGIYRYPLKEVTVFGCPKPGFGKLSKILRNSDIPITIYRNRSDPVSELPFRLGYIIPYQKPVKDTLLNAEPSKRDKLIYGLASDHLMKYYLSGVSSRGIGDMNDQL
jgi:triacylglycerol lipase